jgi:DMSO reductase family type II enzyme heme b subunit
MLAKRVALDSQSLLDTDSPEWGKVQGERVRLAFTPLDRQPSEYVKVVGKQWDYGETDRVTLKSLHNSKEIFFFLEWEDSSKDVELKDQFPDGAGLLFPLKFDAPIDTMGEKDWPVNAWYWRADVDGTGRSFTAEGLGTTQETKDSHILVEAKWADGIWRLVMARSLTVNDQAVQFEAGGTFKVGCAVWQGSNRERAGLKSYSNGWLELELEG